MIRLAGDKQDRGVIRVFRKSNKSDKSEADHHCQENEHRNITYGADQDQAD